MSAEELADLARIQTRIAKQFRHDVVEAVRAFKAEQKAKAPRA